MGHQVEYLTFSEAIEELKQGKKVTRYKWDNMTSIVAAYDDVDESYLQLQRIVLKGLNKPLIHKSVYTVTHEDIFSDDWYLYEPSKKKSLKKKSPFPRLQIRKPRKNQTLEEVKKRLSSSDKLEVVGLLASTEIKQTKDRCSLCQSRKNGAYGESPDGKHCGYCFEKFIAVKSI